MSFTPSPQQLLFLWNVAVLPPGTKISDIEYKLDEPKKNRDPMVDNQLIILKPGPRNSKLLELTQEGWQVLKKNLSTNLARSGVAAVVMQKLLIGFHERMQAGFPAWEELSGACRGFESSADANSTPEQTTPTLPSAASPKFPPVTTLPSSTDGDVRSRLYEACQQLVGDGVYETRIRLADLRRSLPDVPRAEVDRALRELEQKHEGTLMRLDDPREIHAEDEAAALANSSGSPRHVLLLSRS